MICTYWTTGSTQNGPIKYSLSVILPIFSVCPAIGIESLVLSKFWHGARNMVKMCVTAGFCGKKLLPPKLGKYTKNGSKIGFFELTEKFCS